MKMAEIQNRAKALGVQKTSRLRKGELVRTIQQTEGNQDCFGASWRFDCRQHDCSWREDCLTDNPG